MFKIILKFLPLIIHDAFDLFFEIREERKQKIQEKTKK
jgi:hypothetical protein